MTGRLKDSARWQVNEDGEYERIPGDDPPLEPGSQVDHPEEAGEAPGAEAETNEEKTKAELQDELAARGLPTSGNKDELIERLETEG